LVRAVLGGGWHGRFLTGACAFLTRGWGGEGFRAYAGGWCAESSQSGLLGSRKFIERDGVYNCRKEARGSATGEGCGGGVKGLRSECLSGKREE